jgi:hypothetical protein
MKTFTTVYKVTTKACQSCLMAYPSTTLQIKNFLGLSYSTQTWSLPNMRLPGSGIFVCKTLADVRKFVDNNFKILNDDFIVWEAVAMNVRRQYKFIPIGSTRTIEHLEKFWNQKLWDYLKSIGVRVRDCRNKGYYVADAVKLVKQVDL